MKTLFYLLVMVFLLLIGLPSSYSQTLNPQCNNILGEAFAIPSGTLSCTPLPLNPPIEAGELGTITRCFTYLSQGPINLNFLLVSGQCGPFPLYNTLSYNIYTINCDTLVTSGIIIPTSQSVNVYLDILVPYTWYIICYTWTPNCPQSAACPLIYTSLLPIDLLYFKGYYDDNINCVALSWSTSIEKNVDKFIIQKSYDFKNFIDEVEIKAKGNTSVQSDYIVIDCNERLKETTYYKLIEVTFDGERIEQAIIPINKRTITDEPIEIFDLLGKKIYEFNNGVNIVKQGERYYKVVKLK